jgi:hypothetical protein
MPKQWEKEDIRNGIDKSLFDFSIRMKVVRRKRVMLMSKGLLKSVRIC